jgi:hypothetical protein
MPWTRELRALHQLAFASKALLMGDGARSQGFFFGAAYIIVHGAEKATLEDGLAAAGRRITELHYTGLDAAEFDLGARLAIDRLLAFRRVA